MTYYSLICFECIWKLPGEWQSSSRADPLVQFTWVWESAAQQRREVLLLRYLFQKLDALWAFEQDKIRHHTLTIMIMLWSMWLQDTWYWEITCLQGDTKPNSFLQAITLEDSAVAEVEISSNCMQLPPARHRTPRVSWNLPWRPLKKVLDELTVLEVCGTWNTLKHMSMWQKWIAQSWWLPSWKKKTDFAIHQTFVTGFTSFDPNLRGPMIKSSWHLSCERCRVDTLSFCRMPNREALAPMQVA